MADITLLQFIGSVGGIGAIFAFLLFLVYQNTVKQLREDRKFMEDRLTGVIAEYNTTCRDSQSASIELTRVFSELTTWLKAKNGSV
jgi:hypothetical protein